MADAASSHTRIHGTLVEVGGVGLLLLGRSGIGKSECALELIMRGHRLVADDVVLVGKGEDQGVVGWSPELIRHYVELRGIGIINIPSLFGENSVADQARIDLVVQLEAWGASDVDRTGLERQTVRVGEFELASLRLPVAPGRNVASLVEVAARKHLLERSGRSGAADFEKRVVESLRQGSS